MFNILMLIVKKGTLYHQLYQISNYNSIVEFMNNEGKDRALDMFADYDYDGNKLSIKEFSVRILSFLLSYSSLLS